MGIGTTTPRSAFEVSSSTQGQYSNPTPNLTISNSGNINNNAGAVSIDFNPYIASTTNPEAQIEVKDDYIILKDSPPLIPYRKMNRIGHAAKA